MVNNDTETVLTDDSVSLVEELRSIRETTKDLKARESEIRSLLLDELNGAQSGITASGVPVVEVEYQTRYRVDVKRLQALYQDAWEDCQKETEVSVVRLPEQPIEVEID